MMHRMETDTQNNQGANKWAEDISYDQVKRRNMSIKQVTIKYKQTKIIHRPQKGNT